MTDTPAQASHRPAPSPPPAGEGKKCEAVRLATGWECEKCALAWDEGDAKPACSPLTYTRLALALDDEAIRIAQSQEALVIGPDPIRTFRVQERLQRACELRAAMKIVHRAAEESRAKQHKGAG
jgi:hypothetical protein